MPRPQEKVSLHPLGFKEALGDLLKVKPEPKPKKARPRKAPQRNKDQGTATG